MRALQAGTMLSKRIRTGRHPRYLQRDPSNHKETHTHLYRIRHLSRKVVQSVHWTRVCRSRNRMFSYSWDPTQRRNHSAIGSTRTYTRVPVSFMKSHWQNVSLIVLPFRRQRNQNRRSVKTLPLVNKQRLIVHNMDQVQSRDILDMLPMRWGWIKGITPVLCQINQRTWLIMKLYLRVISHMQIIRLTRLSSLIWAWESFWKKKATSRWSHLAMNPNYSRSLTWPQVQSSRISQPSGR